eukprot:m.47091 g.47091  ORF g.47091 m.47091 type:complete len:173 (-) comp6339_c0_seq2:53-571(-)
MVCNSHSALPFISLAVSTFLFPHVIVLCTALGIWDYQWCTEMLCQETYFACNGETDMFWPFQFDMSAIEKHCLATYGVNPRADWIAISYNNAVKNAKNIVFSNGLFDPWSSAGYYENTTERDISSITISESAHHMDLFFNDPQDPQSVRTARAYEVERIRKWIAEYNVKHKH